MSFEVNLPTGGGVIAAYPPKDVTGIKASGGNTKIMLNWSDPTDTVGDDGTTFVKWKGTKVVRKLGAYPVNERDGVQIIDNQVRDAYKTTAFVDTGLTNDQTYYYGFFPYSEENAYNRNEVNRITGVPTSYKIYGVRIDTTNSNPETALTYTDDAVGMQAKSGLWDDFFGIYPCLFKNGVEVGRLNKNNFAKFEDGTSADITSGSAGDVMIAFPRRGLKITTTGNYIDIKMTDDPNNVDFDYLAHTRGSVSKDVFYIGAYKGIVSSNKLRSLSGSSPTVSTTLTNFRTYAQANGSGYELSCFHQLTYRQAMYILKYKNLNSQAALGKGYTGGSAKQSTGATNTKGMDYGSTSSSTERVKLFGIEDFWGNIWEWVDGMFCNSSRHILTGTDSFNNSANGYTDQGQAATGDLSGYLSKIQGTSGMGFLPKVCGGSSSTYYSDYASLYAGYFAGFGGGWNDGDYAGAFCVSVYCSASDSYSNLGARLMYL